MPRQSNSKKIELAVKKLRKLSIDILEMDVNLTLVPLSSPEVVKKEKCICSEIEGIATMRQCPKHPKWEE